MDVNERSDLRPKCPHCECELDRLNSRKIRTQLGVRYVYFCPECLKVLGVSHRKGFWMG